MNVVNPTPVSNSGTIVDGQTRGPTCSARETPESGDPMRSLTTALFEPKAVAPLARKFKLQLFDFPRAARWYHRLHIVSLLVTVR